ncbi:alpha/beta hydrolase [Micromonospora tulbaghiae]|uniref:Alpha/beta hydrolase n=1 Tax=Micromonospora tulbaghiae TaxID=479978 RepID=A0ABY0KSM0_9ACTN|nr:alpha/beta hydrolase [Micromonospora tulbaghiae]MDX5459986.1 alpha/beta hydrolase family protein [Micromonospora tulbaghiae]SCF06947.1 Alpha/beta hydrolase [Micromonospora tulbaghiae]
MSGGPAGAADAPVGYAQLWRADPGAWAAAGAAWRSLAAPVRRRADALTARIGALRPGWSGAASTAAQRRIGDLRTGLTDVLPALIEVDQVLAEFGARLSAAKARLGAEVARAESGGLLVDRTGAVRPDPARVTRTGPAVVHARAGIRDALTLAGTADREAAGRLAELSTAAVRGWVSVPPAWRPGPGAGPAEVSRWWAGLSAAERRWLVGREPGRIGRLDGLPAAARDQANRLLLGDRREQLLVRRLALLHPLPAGPLEASRRVRLAAVEAALRGLDGLSERLAAGGAPRAYLLGLDPAGDGRAVVALGNPDRAASVLTYVPGMTSDLADAPAELGRAARVLQRCAALGPGEEAAAVLWLDYDAPDLLTEAAGTRQAEDAGPALHRFQEGLRAAHEGPPARQTVLGHSYGSLVVGAAARDHGLGADALVFVGSPGVGVDHAADLRMPAGQVWSSTAPDDVIRLARPPDELARRALLSGTPLGPAFAVLGGHGERLWFGADPSGPGFGGRRFPSAPHGHTGYWDPDNPALDGMARIVLGR